MSSIDKNPNSLFKIFTDYNIPEVIGSCTRKKRKTDNRYTEPKKLSKIAQKNFSENTFKYFGTKQTDKDRDYFSETEDDDGTIAKKFPCIHLIEDDDKYEHEYDNPYGDDCVTYAIRQFPDIPKITDERNISKIFDRIVKKQFSNITIPQKGDLAVYFNNTNSPCHFGIYFDDLRIESKWGPYGSGIFIHLPFHVPVEYGDKIKFYRFNLDVSIKK